MHLLILLLPSSVSQYLPQCSIIKTSSISTYSVLLQLLSTRIYFSCLYKLLLFGLLTVTHCLFTLFSNLDFYTFLTIFWTFYTFLKLLHVMTFHKLFMTFHYFSWYFLTFHGFSWHFRLHLILVLISWISASKNLITYHLSLLVSS